MQIERTFTGITALGPGNRMAVWVNGCPRNCPGCISPNLRREAPENECNVAEYFSAFAYDDIDGVSISGGEPFYQAAELLSLVRFLRDKGIKDILVYTGYTLAELIAMRDPTVDAILGGIAVLIDGPYIAEENDDTGNLAGSKNQKIHIFDESFRKRYEDYASNKREVQTFNFGSYVLSVGIPTKEYIRKFNESI